VLRPSGSRRFPRNLPSSLRRKDCIASLPPPLSEGHCVRVFVFVSTLVFCHVIVRPYLDVQAKSRKRLTMPSAKHMLSARHSSCGGVVVNPSSDTPLGQLRIAKRKWRGLTNARFMELRALLQRYKFSIALGEVTNIDNHWYVTHSGLIHLAFRRRCGGIETTLEDKISPSSQPLGFQSDSAPI
jgi:hypothetical protein